MKEKKEKKEKKSGQKNLWLFKILIIVVFLFGIALLVYPSLGNIISCVQQQQVVEEYEKQIAQMYEKDIEMQKDLAVKYNKSLSQITLQDPFENIDEPTEAESKQSLDSYFDMLSVGGQNMMGYIKIPKISVSLPIYHGASEAQLQKGVGHLNGTSLPVGGEGTHCVLSGHTGVPGNMLFTDLDKLEIGDRFYLHVLDEVLAYKVDSINVIDPDDTSKIKIEPGKDYCTLLTCTPYGINTHRLLVRGERTAYTEGEDDENVDVIEVTDADGNVVETRIAPKDYIEIFGLRIPNWVAYVLIPILSFLLILLVLIIVRKRNREKDEEEKGKVKEGDTAKENDSAEEDSKAKESDKPEETIKPEDDKQ